MIKALSIIFFALIVFAAANLTIGISGLRNVPALPDFAALVLNSVLISLCLVGRLICLKWNRSPLDIFHPKLGGPS